MQRSVGTKKEQEKGRQITDLIEQRHATREPRATVPRGKSGSSVSDNSERNGVSIESRGLLRSRPLVSRCSWIVGRVSWLDTSSLYTYVHAHVAYTCTHTRERDISRGYYCGLTTYYAGQRHERVPIRPRGPHMTPLN